MAVLIPLQLVRVTGASMTPTLLSGDWLLVRHGAGVRPGLVVLARFAGQPNLPVLKRAVEQRPDGWWLLSDNRRIGSDSRQYGSAEVQAVAIWQWCRRPARRASLRQRWLGRRLPAAPPDGL